MTPLSVVFCQVGQADVVFDEQCVQQRKFIACREVFRQQDFVTWKIITVVEKQGLISYPQITPAHTY